jgi:hypothetical protein
MHLNRTLNGFGCFAEALVPQKQPRGCYALWLDWEHE